MNTFLPYPDYALSAHCLDDKRLGKQRVEVLQILNTLRGLKRGWQHHPAVLMWRGYEESLCHYGLFVCCEWRMRGHLDTCYPKIIKFLTGHLPSFPPWLGNFDFHRSHQSKLLRKDPEWYGQFGWDVPDDLPYIWPDRGD